MFILIVADVTAYYEAEIKPDFRLLVSIVVYLQTFNVLFMIGTQNIRHYAS